MCHILIVGIMLVDESSPTILIIHYLCNEH